MNQTPRNFFKDHSLHAYRRLHDTPTRLMELEWASLREESPWLRATYGKNDMGVIGAIGQRKQDTELKPDSPGSSDCRE